MITKDKVIEIFCIIDEFDKNLHSELNKNLSLPSKDASGKYHRNRKGNLCESEIIHLLCNDSGEVITFCLTGANVDDRDERVWNVFAKVLYGKVFADRGYIKKELFDTLFDQGIQLVHGLKANMKNKLMPLWDKITLRKRYIIECINELLKNKANLVHSRHRSIHNFIMNICSALTAYCFFENKPEALPVHVEQSRQLELF